MKMIRKKRIALDSEYKKILEDTRVVSFDGKFEISDSISINGNTL